MELEAAQRAVKSALRWCMTLSTCHQEEATLMSLASLTKKAMLWDYLLLSRPSKEKAGAEVGKQETLKAL